MQHWIQSKGIVALAVGALALPACFSVQAEPCAVLQYEEMKDMSVEELTQAFCNAANMWQENNDAAIAGFFNKTANQATRDRLDTEATQCKNESDRIVA